MDEAVERPMFPLESVLVPGMVLPLHVFEPRYRAMIRTCLDSHGEFGVVLIERGSEVGGGDVRSPLGTMAGIVQAEELDDGRWAVVAVGIRRVRVEAWLDDDPYPRALVADVPEQTPRVGSVEEHALEAAYRERVEQLRGVLALAARLGFPVSPEVEIVDDAVLGSHQLSIVAPIGPLDRQMLLGCPGPGERLALLESMLDEEALVLAAQLDQP